MKLQTNGWSLQKDDNPTYLGVTFDTRLTWKKQTEKCLKRGMQRTPLIKKMAGSKWGTNNNILKNTYHGYVRPVLEYGISCWGQTASSNFQKVKKVQHQNLRLMTGAMKSTPIREMETLSGLQSIEDRRDSKTLIQEEKYKTLPSLPMYKRLRTQKLKPRLKRKSFIVNVKTLRKSMDISMDTEPEQVTVANP